MQCTSTARFANDIIYKEAGGKSGGASRRFHAAAKRTRESGKGLEKDLIRTRMSQESSATELEVAMLYSEVLAQMKERRSAQGQSDPRARDRGV